MPACTPNWRMWSGALIVYRGYGMIVLFSLILVMGALVLGLHESGVDLKASSLLHDHAWPLGGAFAVTGVVNVVYGLIANRGRNRAAIDPTTGLRVRMGTRHSLYFIPVEIWGIGYLVVAGVFFASRPF
jgi:hypothetical protein